MKSKTLPPAASGCRRGAGKPAARRAGQRSFLCCSPSMSLWLGHAARSYDFSRRQRRCSPPLGCRSISATFENMRISKEAQEGLSSLVVEGTIVSVSNGPSEVPRLRFSARDSAGQEVYTWPTMPGRGIVGPGEKLDFRTRFVSPPDNAVDVMVRFVNAQDATPAAK